MIYMSNESIKIDFRTIEVLDLNEKPIPLPELNKTLGNKLYITAPSIEVADLGRRIHKDPACMMTVQEIDTVISIMKMNPIFGIPTHMAILKYLEDRKLAPTKPREQEIKEIMKATEALVPDSTGLKDPSIERARKNLKTRTI